MNGRNHQSNCDLVRYLDSHRPWTVTAVITPGLCYHVTLQGRRERVPRSIASHIKPYHLRLPPLRHDFSDEYAHFAWDPDLGLAGASALASPIYTLVDRCPIRYFQHAHFIYDPPRQHWFGTTLRLTGPVPADSRQ